jgi:hypothetical protein
MTRQSLFSVLKIKCDLRETLVRLLESKVKALTLGLLKDDNKHFNPKENYFYF